MEHYCRVWVGAAIKSFVEWIPIKKVYPYFVRRSHQKNKKWVQIFEPVSLPILRQFTSIISKVGKFFNLEDIAIEFYLGYLIQKVNSLT